MLWKGVLYLARIVQKMGDGVRAPNAPWHVTCRYWCASLGCLVVFLLQVFRIPGRD